MYLFSWNAEIVVSRLEGVVAWFLWNIEFKALFNSVLK